MVKAFVFIVVTLFFFKTFSGMSSQNLIEGRITKIEAQTVTIINNQGKDMIVPKSSIEKKNLKMGKVVTVVIDIPRPKR